MKDIRIKNIKTERLLIKKASMDEQYVLWDILRNEKVNRYYFPTPDRIFTNNHLRKDNIDDLRKARQIFMDQLNDWDRQLPFYKKKIEAINNEDNNQKFTWSIFLDDEPIGQITCQPSDDPSPAIRDVGWFINPKYQKNGYGSEAALAVLTFMFAEVEIDKIVTSAAIINPGSWLIMKKLGFTCTGEKTTTYFDDEGNILKAYCYECTRDMFLTKNKIKVK